MAEGRERNEARLGCDGGIGCANFPPEDLGKPIKHAWIEQHGIAYDCVLLVQQDRDVYRANLKLSFVVEYTKAEALAHWKRTDMPGPWDPEIAAEIGKFGEQAGDN